MNNLNEFMGQFKESDFNQNLTMVGFVTKEQGIFWHHSDRKCECFHCGIACDNYCLKKDGKKLFACSSCLFKIKV